MKWLVVLIVLLCVLLALWYFRDDITGARLRFVERELGGARFKVPNWRESVYHDDPDDGRLILKHKRNDNRIVSIAWQSAAGPSTQAERTTAVRETARALAAMTDSKALVRSLDTTTRIGGAEGIEARAYSLTFTPESIGPGRLYMWTMAATKQRWFFAIVNDDADERERITHELFESFTPGVKPITQTGAKGPKLVFDAPPSWRVQDETRTSIAYVSPDEDALLELHHGKRTSRPRMTKEYAQSLAKNMIEATGATWQPQSTALKRDSRLGTTVAIVRGTARIAADERHYEIRLWIAPSTSLLYVATLSTFDQTALDRFSTAFDRISIAD